MKWKYISQWWVKMTHFIWMVFMLTIMLTLWILGRIKDLSHYTLMTSPPKWKSTQEQNTMWCHQRLQLCEQQWAIVKHKKTINLVAYRGTRIQTCGKATMTCFLKERGHSLLFFIVDVDVTPLLGFFACLSMGIVKSESWCTSGHHGEHTEFSSQIFTQFNHVFSDKLWELSVTSAMTVDPDV